VRRYNRRVAEPRIGSTLAGYRIDSLLARGGMGVVYRATQIALDRPVALKVVAHGLAEQGDFRERFLRESRLAAKLEHPNVVPVYDAREGDGELLVAMRLVEGGDLRRLIDREGPLEPERAIDLLGQAADALDAAHAAGIVHRDVKPHNILVEGGRAYLSDFGLAKVYERSAGSSASIVGTVEYMAPEQWRGERVGPAADIYSLGCVLYEALTGIVPYARKESDVEPELPQGMGEVIERAVDKDPQRRYATAGEMIAAARECQGAVPAATQVLMEAPTDATRRLRHPPTWVLSSLAAAIVAVIVAVLALEGGGGVSVAAPIRVAPGPLRLATGGGYVWATSAAEGTLSRIDPNARTVVGTPLRLGRGVAGVAVGEGSVWVADPRHGDVLRIAVDSERVLGRIEVGGRPGAIAFGGHRVWVADEAGAGITAINAAGGRILKRGIAPHSAPLRLAVGAGGLWVSSASTGSIRRIDLGEATPSPAIPVGRGPSGITVGHGYVWVANSRSESVARVDPSIAARLGEPIEVGGHPGGIDAGTDVVWVANASEDSVIRIDLASGEVGGHPVSVGAEPGAVVVGEEAVWVANNGDGTVTRIEP
jgi:DNA-binding beta-propeller fold protein YncE/predicted Ser/Thr protein kinase